MFFSVGSLTWRRIEPLVRGHGVIFILLMILLLAGCAEGGGGSSTATANLNGTWKDNYGTTITINTSAKTIEYSNSYKGTIENTPKYTAVNGVLIIKFTKYTDADYSNYPEVTYNENTENIGKYGALYWKDLTSNSVYMADAYTGYTHTMFGTLSEAQTNFTLDRAGNYIDWSITSPYTK
jgi:hypothetical protein